MVGCIIDLYHKLNTELKVRNSTKSELLNLFFDL